MNESLESGNLFEGQKVMKIDKKGRTRPRMTLDVQKKVQPLADFMNESFQKWKRPYDYLVFDDFIMKSGASNDPLQTTYKEKARFRLGQAQERPKGTTGSGESYLCVD